MKRYWFISLGVVVAAALVILVKAAGGNVVPGPGIIATAGLTTSTPDLSTMRLDRALRESPDGKWIVEDITAYPSDKNGNVYYLGLIARRTDGSGEWRLVDEWIQKGDERPSSAGPLLWSKDGRSLYYTLYIRKSLEDRCKFDPRKYDLETMEYGRELRKVDLESGEVTELTSCAFSDFAYSPDRTILPYIGDGEIVLIGVDSGWKHVIPFNIGQKRVRFIGYINWSPDSQAFAFNVQIGGDGPERENVVWVVDVPSLSAKPLVIEGEQNLEIGQWEAPGRLVLVDGWPPSKQWIWDRQSDTITFQPVPTATPAPWGMPTPDLAAMRVERLTSTSPDGDWIAETTIALPDEIGYVGGSLSRMYTGLTVRRTDGKVTWTVVDKWETFGLGWSYPWPLRWSKDGRSLYYTYRVVPDGGVVFPPESGLYQVDLASGQVMELLARSLDLEWLALSPDEKIMAYVKQNLLPAFLVVLRDLGSGEERSVSIAPLGRRPDVDEYGVKIIWSPDKNTLAITEANGMETNGGFTSIVVVDVRTLAVTPVVLEDRRYRVVEEWPEPDRLLLKDPQGQWWQLDLTTRTLLPAQAPTPAASPSPACQPTSTPTPITPLTD